MKVAELFMKGGVGRQARWAGASTSRCCRPTPRARVWDRPLAVLVDNGTAGAGEIVAAALLDAGRAQLVGERTFGRAAVQKAIPLPEGGLVLTVAKYMSPKGNADPRRRGSSRRCRCRRTTTTSPPSGKPDAILEKALEVLKAEGRRPRKPRPSAIHVGRAA